MRRAENESRFVELDGIRDETVEVSGVNLKCIRKKGERKDNIEEEREVYRKGGR